MPLPQLLHGKTRARAFLDHHIKLNDWLNARDITMMMYHDMIDLYANQRKPITLPAGVSEIGFVPTLFVPEDAKHDNELDVALVLLALSGRTDVQSR